MEHESLSFEDLQQGVSVSGVIPNQLVRVAAAIPMGNAVNLVYITADGDTGQEIIDQDSIGQLRIVKA